MHVVQPRRRPFLFVPNQKLDPLLIEDGRDWMEGRKRVDLRSP